MAVMQLVQARLVMHACVIDLFPRWIHDHGVMTIASDHPCQNVELMRWYCWPSDTEMEADVEPSVETKERLEREQLEAAQRMARLEAAEADEAHRKAAAAEATALEAAQRERLRQVSWST